MFYFRLTSIFEQYFGHGPVVEDLKERVSFTKRPAQELYDYGVYDKVSPISSVAFLLLGKVSPSFQPLKLDSVIDR